LASEPLGHFEGVLFVLQDDVAVGPALARHRVVGHRDEVARVAFIDQLEHRSTGKDRDVVAVRLNRRQDLAPVWLSRLPPLHPQGDSIRRAACASALGFASGRLCLSRRGAGEKRALKKISSLHEWPPGRMYDTSRRWGVG